MASQGGWAGGFTLTCKLSPVPTTPSATGATVAVVTDALLFTPDSSCWAREGWERMWSLCGLG